jgi:density-regulated protein DRP1
VEELKAGEEGKDGVPKAEPQKKKKKVTMQADVDKHVKIYKTKRGQKKTICFFVGLQQYGVVLKDASKIMGKKFACGASVVTDPKYGECIEIQGDIEKQYEIMKKIINVDLEKYAIPFDKIKFEEVKKKKKAEEEE